ncbi:MAG: hypothetical protein V1740_00455 [Candidatus Woesearchaeota archaeon]
MKAKIKDVNCYVLSGMAQFKGFVKNGFDSSTIINLITVFDSNYDKFRKRGFTFPPNLFFFHEISVPETIGVLINKHKLTKEEAKEALNKLIANFNLSKIIRKSDLDLDYEKIVEEANKRVVNKDPKLKIGEQDIIIIGGFLREKINFVHSGDSGFLKTCEELNINTIPTPKRDIEKENQINKFMKDRV